MTQYFSRCITACAVWKLPKICAIPEPTSAEWTPLWFKDCFPAEDQECVKTQIYTRVRWFRALGNVEGLAPLLLRLLTCKVCRTLEDCTFGYVCEREYVFVDRPVDSWHPSWTGIGMWENSTRAGSLNLWAAFMNWRERLWECYIDVETLLDWNAYNRH